MEKRIRVKDLAPFASIEDLGSDERESPLEGEKHKITLANIDEDAKTSKITPTMMTSATTTTTTNTSMLKMNLNVTSTTPRIDISRASSSSHQDDSSPERELILGAAKDSKLEIEFGEDKIASELHSSTEELSFHDNEEIDKNRLKKSRAVSISDMQREAIRKDSGCSADVAFLSISGRTSRVSSVGSVASGGSAVSNISGLSHCSAASCLSAVSNLSRGSSPHRTSVETSFCGKKPVHMASVDDEYAIIVSKQVRSHSLTDTRNGVHQGAADEKLLEKPRQQQQQQQQRRRRQSQQSQPANVRKSRSKHATRKRPTIENPKTQKFVSLYSDEDEKSIAVDAAACCGAAVNVTSARPQPQLQPHSQSPLQTQSQLQSPSLSLSQSSRKSPSAGRRSVPGLDPHTQIFIPLRGDSIEEKDVAATPPKVKNDSGNVCPPNPFSPKRMKPFTNATLVNFISKYDVRRNTLTPKSSAAAAASPPPRTQIYEEFQKFIHLMDDDDPSGGGGGGGGGGIRTGGGGGCDKKGESAVARRVRVDRMTVPVQVHRSRSLSENITCATVVEDSAQLSKSDSGIRSPTPPPSSVSTSGGGGGGGVCPCQNSLRLSDSLLEQRLCETNDSKLVDRCHSASVTTASASFLFSSAVAATQQSPSFAQLNYRDCGARAAKSMTQLSVSGKYSASNSPSINACAISGAASAACSRTNEYPLRRCSESAKEMRNMDKMKSRSGSIKSLLRSFFNKNGDTKTEQNYHTENTAPIELKPIQIPQYSRRAANTAETIIIPLHSPDFDYEAAAVTAISKVSTADDDKKDTMAGITVAVVEPSSLKEKEPPDRIANQFSSRAGVHNDSMPETSVAMNDSRKIETTETTTVVQCHIPSSPVTSSSVSQGHIHYHNQQCSSSKMKPVSKHHNHRPSVNSTSSSKFENSLEISLPEVELYSSLPSASKKANEEETADEVLSTDSDKSHPIVHEHDGEENKKLVNQEESFEELPYVPTTLPIERSVAVPIIPIKERSNNDMLVHSVERPRSLSCHTTSLNLNATSAVTTTTTVFNRASTSEKIHITLPRTDAVVNSPKRKRRNSEKCEILSPSPPPLPPRKSTKSASWICFDENKQFESRQSPRRITTLPSSYVNHHIDRNTPSAMNFTTAITHSTNITVECDYGSINQRIVFVNPNECSCDCHGIDGTKSSSPSHNTISTISFENSNVRL